MLSASHMALLKLQIRFIFQVVVKIDGIALHHKKLLRNISWCGCYMIENFRPLLGSLILYWLLYGLMCTNHKGKNWVIFISCSTVPPNGETFQPQVRKLLNLNLGCHFFTSQNYAGLPTIWVWFLCVFCQYIKYPSK